MINPYSFEIIVEISGKQEIDGIYSEERMAIDRAQILLESGKYSSVRVYRVNSDNKYKMIFERMYSKPGSDLQISPIDEAYLCITVSDVYSFSSRQTVMRLLRGYFDRQATVALELLHDYTDLNYIERDTRLFSHAGHRLAALQAQTAKISPHDRQAVLMRLFREVMANARSTGSLLPYSDILAAHGLSQLVSAVTASLPAAEQARAITFAMSRRLQKTHDWPLKLSVACDLFEENLNEPSQAYLDELLAEIINGNTPVRAILGYAPDLATALEALLAALNGSLVTGLPGTEPMQKLSSIMSHRPLRMVKEAILDRVAAALASKIPLTKLNRASNANALRRLLPKLQDSSGFMGGPAMSIAITRRAKIDFSTALEDLSFEQAVNMLLDRLAAPIGKAGYLLDLYCSDLGRAQAPYIIQKLADLFAGIRNIADFAPNQCGNWSHDRIREDFRRRFHRAGIPRRLADELLLKQRWLDGTLTGIEGVPSPPAAAPAPARERENLRLMLTHNGTTHVVVPSETPFSIGRGKDCRLTIDCASASRIHALIHVEGGDFVLFDQSKNGTFVSVSSKKFITLTNSSMALNGQGLIIVGGFGNSPEARERSVIEFQKLVQT